MTHLSTRILKPSLHQSFEEKFVDSLVATLANRSVAQGSEKAKKTQDTYGHISESTSGQLDLFGAFSKMSEVTPRWGYGESCPIWKKMVTERSGDCSQRRKQARLTNASESSSWRNYPTTEAHTVEKYSLQKDGQKKTQRSRNLTAMAINGELGNWATPQASDHVEGARTAKESNQKCLGRDLNQMQNWATPNTMDHLPPKTGEALARNKKKGGCKNLREDVNNPKMNGLQDQEKSNTSGKNQGSWPTPKELDSRKQRPLTNGKNQSLTTGTVYGTFLNQKVDETGKSTGKLNPNWVEALMLGRGMTGWTQLPTEWIVSDS